jgi:site-specific recombinase XerD
MRKSNNPSIVIARLINYWLNDYLLNRNIVSNQTVKGYNETLTSFLNFLENEKSIDGVSFSPEAFCVKNIEDWLIYQKDVKGNKPSSCNTRLGSIRTFLKFVAKEDRSLAYLYFESKGIQKMIVPKTKIEGISKEAMKILLNTPDRSTKTGRCYLTLFTTMYNTGVRMDEIISLQVNNLFFDTKYPCIRVIGKGSKIRTLSIFPKTVGLLKNHLRENHGSTLLPNSYVFYSRNTGFNGKLSQNAVNKQLKKYAKQAHEKCNEIPINFHAHQIRHSISTHLLENGMNIVQISELLGHSSIQTTMVYLGITMKMKQEACEIMEDPDIKKIPKKWKNDKSLIKLSGIKDKKIK